MPLIPATPEGRVELYYKLVVLILTAILGTVGFIAKHVYSQDLMVAGLVQSISDARKDQDETRSLLFNHITNHPKDMILPIAPAVNPKKRGGPRIERTVPR